MSSDEVTPLARPPVANPSNVALVTALWNHALVLEEVHRRVGELRDRIAGSTAPAGGAELVEIGRVFRREADSAVDVARAAERQTEG